ncbi:hypothetical protein J6590_087016 [Homalodisca vitripennis]|nr:hypothetical protein J6590_087016 [Homalodisca vitripennis]
MDTHKDKRKAETTAYSLSNGYPHVRKWGLLAQHPRSGIKRQPPLSIDEHLARNTALR